ncbi:Ribosomal protein S6--L-glutamate ligase [wastewater metagenome]|uniref:Ribosomal protein S6--L-glutamate ligase n=2 Tax=unclassified sequences TaxID=12908 RepID=A0A5B8R695_9ZZZZ|nr:RimK family protein [Arhodomonas sp. KWT]QEA04469.1 ribosomal protein S6--L-glutamate ligase [uncultured organism]
MTRTLIVVEHRRDWAPYAATSEVITADDYLFDPACRGAGPGTRVINLCRGYRYLSTGYYCSLLAEARGHRVIPSVRTISDLSRRAIYSLDTAVLDERLRGPLTAESGDGDGPIKVDVFFGTASDPRFRELARQVFETFAAPLLHLELHRQDGRWRIARLRTLSLNRLDDAQETAFAAALERFSHHVWRRPRHRRTPRYDLAILHDPDERLPPSNARALRHFQRVGRGLGVTVDLITRRDYGRLAEYDALFIRETTAVSDHTYRFAKRAEAEGMPVIDDAASILRCTNKVYLADLLETHGIPRPAGRILHRGRRDDLAAAGDALGFPLVLKIPDGSFSRGVVRVAAPETLSDAAAGLFAHSDLIIAQQFVVSDFDWRIGVLDGEAIFACQYFFPRGHWQIVRHGPGGTVDEGDARTFPVAEAPQQVVHLAVRAANLIGRGLYGVDVKQAGRRALVIEVNDNPNLDAGVEDACLGDTLYRRVLESFIRRLEARHRGPA